MSQNKKYEAEAPAPEYPPTRIRCGMRMTM